MARARTRRVSVRRRGTAAVVAMLFLVLMTTLCLGMYGTATLNAQSASNLADVRRAQTAAESGLRWQQYRFKVMARPTTDVGNLSAAYLDAVLWPMIRSAIANDYDALPSPGAAEVIVADDGVTATDLTLADASRVTITVTRLRGYETDPSAEDYRHALRVTSVGAFNGIRRGVSMDFRVDKKVNFAVVGKTRIQLGRNTMVEGPVAMTTPNKGNPLAPFLILSDFAHFHDGLRSVIEDFQRFCREEQTGYDNRIPVGNPSAYARAVAAGFDDYDGDGHVDEFDLFLDFFDSDRDGAVSRAEFTNPVTGQLYDDNLFTAIDSMGWPMFDGDAARDGLNDGYLDGRDGYAKVRGGVVMADTASAWDNFLRPRGSSINEQMQGPIVTQSGGSASTFGATQQDLIDLNPANFEECAQYFQARSGSGGGTTRRYTQGGRRVIENATLSGSDWTGDLVNERTPYGSTSYQATYRRPVFRDTVFRNVIIPKGSNALFDNCTFEGVTFIDMTRDIVVSSRVRYDSTNGMNWSRRMKSGSFSKDTVLTGSNSHGYSDGNNIRFHNCTFNGPLASPYSTAYTHFTNSWEFTGATMFDNQVDQTATIVAPQTNIEMGSFTNPNAAPSTLVGVVVAGNIDIRGTSVVDGSILVTGDGAGNTTLSYFGASDSDTNPGAMPEGGFGRLNIRYNPYRALPDGIRLPVTIEADPSSYREGI